MIQINAVVQGEPDAPPLYLSFSCNSVYEEEIFSNTVSAANSKLARRAKLNVNESLYIYFGSVVSCLRQHMSHDKIVEMANSLITVDMVLIGVAESIQNVAIAASVDDLPRANIELAHPIRKPKQP